MDLTTPFNIPLPDAEPEDLIPQLRTAFRAINDALVGAVGGGGTGTVGLADPGSPGFVVRTSAGATVARQLIPPGEGFTIIDQDGIDGNPVFVLQDDLAALEALSGTGFARRTGPEAWSLSSSINLASDVSGSLPWASVNKTGSSLADLATRSAGDLSSGTLLAARMPALTGDVTTVLGGVDTTIGALKVVNSMIANSTIDLTAKVTNVLPAGNGGTGQSAYAVGDLLYASGAAALSKLPDVATGNALLSGGVATAPAWGKVGLTTHVSGILPSANGGTGIAFFAAAGPSILRTYTFPDANASIARTSGTNTFQGTQTFASHIIPDLTDTSDLGSATKLFRKGWLSELDTILFSQNTQTLIGGWAVLTKNEGAIPVGQDIGTGDTTIDFGQAMTLGDFVVFRSSLQVEYVQVGALSSGTRYTVTRNLDGSGANAWPAGSVYRVDGNSTNGRIELNANATPRISVIKQGATYNAQTEMLRIGDLNGWGPYVSETYGFVAGQYGVNGRSSLAIDDSGIRFYNNVTERIRLMADGSGFLANSLISWDTAGNLTVTGNATIAGWVVTSTYLNKGSVYVASEFDIPAGAHAWFGKSAAGYYGLNLKHSDGKYIQAFANNSTVYPYITINDGTYNRVVIGGLNAAFGSDGSTNSMGMKVWNSSGTKLVEFSDAQNIISGWTIGATTITSTGIVLSSGANAYLSFGTTPPTSASSGTGLFQDRTGLYGLASNVVQAKFDAATGKITAGAGNIFLDANGLTLAPGSSAVNSVKWITGATTNMEIVGVGIGNNFISSVYSRAVSTTLGYATLYLGSVNQGGESGAISITRFSSAYGSPRSSRGYIVLSPEGVGASGGVVIGNVAFDTIANAMLDVRGSALFDGYMASSIVDAATNSVAAASYVSHYSSGTPAAGFGVAQSFFLKSSTTTALEAAHIIAQWTTATHASRTSALVFHTVTNAGASAESARMYSGNFTAKAKLRATGNATTAAGEGPGVEFGWYSGGPYAFCQAYDYDTLAYKQLSIDASVIILNANSAQGVVVGSPTGGNKGSGSINAVTVWRNGTSLDYVLEPGYIPASIGEMSEYFKLHHHLPTIATRKINVAGSTNEGALTDALWETAEVHALYITQLHSRINALEISPDEALITKHGPFTHGLEEMRSITPILYSWNQKSGMEMNYRYPGFSAQNVMASIPEAVFKGSGFYNLYERGLTATMWNGIKQLDAITQRHDKDIDQLHTIIAAQSKIIAAQGKLIKTLVDAAAE